MKKQILSIMMAALLVFSTVAPAFAQVPENEAPPSKAVEETPNTATAPEVAQAEPPQPKALQNEVKAMDNPQTFGQCGDNLTWNLTEDGVLTICGTGAMKDFSDGYFADWYMVREKIKEIKINEGVSTIGQYAFYRCVNLINANIPNSVTYIGGEAFTGCDSLQNESVVALGYCGSGGEEQEFFEKGPRDIVNTKNEKNLIWKLQNNGLLTISGKGYMRCWSKYGEYNTIGSPWNIMGDRYWNDVGSNTINFGYPVDNIVIEPGVRSIGTYAFWGQEIKSITIPNSVEWIGGRVFSNGVKPTVKGYHSSYAESFAINNDLPFEALDVTNENKTTITIAGKEPNHYLSGKTNYATGSQTTLEDGTHIRSQFIVNPKDRLDVVGTLFIDNGGELVIDGFTMINDNLVINGGGKVTVRSGGELHADAIIAQGGLWGMNCGYFEVQTNGLAVIDKDLTVKNDAYVNMYSGSKLVVKENMNMETHSDKSQFYGGDLFIGMGINFKNSSKNFQATSDHSTIFYQAQVDSNLINGDREYRFGNIFAGNNAIYKELSSYFKHSGYCGRFAGAYVDTKKWTYKSGQGIKADDADWSKNVDQEFYKIANSGAFSILCDRMNNPQKEALNKMTAVWVASLKMPIYKGMADVGIKKFYANIKIKLNDNKYHDATLYCDSFGAGNYAQFYNVTMLLEGTRYNVGFGAKGNIEKYAEQAGEYVRDEFMDAYLNYADDALGSLFTSIKGKLSWGVAKSFLKKNLCKHIVTANDESIQDIYKNAEKKITDYVQIVELGEKVLDELDGSKSARLMSLQSEENLEADVPSFETNRISLEQSIQQESEQNVAALSAVQINAPVKVVDELLKAELEPLLGKDSNGDLDYSKAGSITYLNLGNRYIQNLTGLENFTNLKMLMLGNNEVQDLTPIKDLANLEYLDISGMYISDLNQIAHLKNLRVLLANNNGLKDISKIQNLSNLTLLNIENNQILDISALKNLSNLETLSVSNNPLKENGLDSITGIETLQVIEAGDCALKKIAPFKSENLKNINLKANALNEMSCLQNTLSLNKLDLSYNTLSDITALNKLANLNSLNLEGNQSIKSFEPLQGLSQLRELNMSNTMMKDNDIENLKNLTNLNTLNISKNPICDLGCILDLEKLSEIVISDTALDTVDAGLLEDKGVSVKNEQSPFKPRELYFSNTETTGESGSIVYQPLCSYPYNDNIEGVQWKSSDPSIAEVSEKGIVTMKKEGTATITATLDDLSCAYTLKVNQGSVSNLGDVNADGSINASDALLALRHSVKEITLDNNQFTRGDVNKDKAVNASDALQILRYSVKEINVF